MLQEIVRFCTLARFPHSLAEEMPYLTNQLSPEADSFFTWTNSSCCARRTVKHEIASFCTVTLFVRDVSFDKTSKVDIPLTDMIIQRATSNDWF